MELVEAKGARRECLPSATNFLVGRRTHMFACGVVLATTLKLCSDLLHIEIELGPDTIDSCRDEAVEHPGVSLSIFLMDWMISSPCALSR